MQFVDAIEQSDGVVVFRLLPAAGDFGTQLHPIHEEITSLIEMIRDSQDLRAAVITGVDDVFYVGPPLDNLLTAITHDPGAVDGIISDARRIVLGFANCDKPIIAAVNGKAIGLGCQLAFMSDFCFAVPNASFQDTHVRVGLPAGDGGAMIYPLLFGLARAKRFLLTGERMEATVAVELGGVEALVDPDELLSTAINRAHRMVGANYDAIRSTKAALHRFMLGDAIASFDFAVLAEKSAMRDARTHEIMKDMVERGS